MSQPNDERAEGTTGWQDDWPVATGAAVLAAAVWVVATQVLGVDLALGTGQQVNVVSVVVTSLVVAVAGAGLLRVLERRTAHGLRTWTVIAGVVWGLSFAGPLRAATVAAGLGLACLHLVVGGVVVLGLRRRHAVRALDRTLEPAPDRVA